MNVIVISGRLGGDPVTNFKNDEQVTNFSIAFSPAKDKTCWLKVVCFKKLAETADKYFTKGDKVGIVGRIDESKWTAADGTEKSAWQIIASSFEFIQVKGLQGKDEDP